MAIFHSLISAVELNLLEDLVVEHMMSTRGEMRGRRRMEFYPRKDFLRMRMECYPSDDFLRI